MSKRLLYAFLMTVLIGGASIASYRFAFERFEQLEIQNSTERLSLYQAGLRSTLERVAHLPRVVVLHPNTNEVLRQGKSIVAYNEYLKSINDKAGAAALYLLNADGTTVAASNYDTDESFVGNNYRFRKYYTDAIEGGSGKFFAVGVTTNRPGYFQSEAIYQNDKPLGVAVVKVEFNELLKYWEDARENVLITNADGIVVLASNPERLYKTLREIPGERLAEMKESRKFAGYTLEPLNFESEGGVFAGRVSIGGNNFSVSTVNTSGIGWKLHFLTPLDSVHNSALLVASMTFLLFGLGGIGFLYARSRAERTRLEIVAAQAEQVQVANTRLEKEVAERKKTEEQLRDMQAELIQSSRLAALGQMSAAIVHEVNQPVSAIRTYTSSGQLLLKNRRTREAKDVFSQIAKMTERLAAITSDLLVFSRKPVSKPNNIDLNLVIQDMVEERAPTIADKNLSIELDLWNRPLIVKGSEHRLEQLVGNLLQNAIQACETDAEGRVLVTSLAATGTATIMVSDNGSGISEEIKDQLFDPFFTTKGIGKGVGLGLALSYAIVDEAGGRIRCENRDEGGARFVVELPLAESGAREQEAEHVSG